MQKLLPNQIIQEHLLLKEQLSLNSVTSQSTWSLKDLRTGDDWVAVFDHGHITKLYTKEKYTQLSEDSAAKRSDLHKPVAAKNKFSEPFRNTHNSLTQWIWAVCIFVCTFLLIKRGAPTFRQLLNTEEPDLSQYPNQDTAKNYQQFPAKVSQHAADKYEDILDSLPSLSKQRNDSIFTLARKAFTDLTYRDPASPLIDRVGKLCINKGVQAENAYYERNIPIAKYYALQWYHTAEILTPSANTKAKIQKINEAIIPSQKQKTKNKRSKTANYYIEIKN